MNNGFTVIHIADQQTDAILDFIEEDSYWDDVRTRSLENQLDTLDFTTFTDERFAQFLVKRNRIIIPNRDGTLSEYIIEENEQTGERVKEVFCSASYIELSRTRWISPVTTGALTAEQHVASALAGTEWQVVEVPFNGVRDFTFDQYTDALTYLRRVASEFELELYFRVEHNGTRVTKRYVEFTERIGKWGGYEANFGKDITNLVRTEKTTEVVTKLIAVGPDRQEGQGPLVVEVADDEALVRWGRNGQHLVDVYRPETADRDMTETRLRQLAQAELDKRLNGQISYSISIVNLADILGIEEQELKLGDSIRVKDEGFSPALYVDARVHTVKGSIKSDAIETIELGDFIEYTADEIFAFFRSLQAELAKKIEQAELADYVVEYGGSTIVRSSTAPTDTTVFWLDTSVIPNVLKSWDGYEWIKATPTNAEEVGAETPEGALDKAIVESLRTELQVLTNTKTGLQATYEGVLSSAYLTDTAVSMELSTRYTAYNNAYTALTNAINAAIADEKVSPEEAGQLASHRGTYRTELQMFSAYLEVASESVRDSLIGESETFVQEYYGRKIYQGTTAPTNKEVGTLWIDISVLPYVWKRWDGSAWVKAIPTDMQELTGKITKTQITDGAITAPAIAANVITSAMISTAGLDAGVIKVGTLGANVLFAGQLYGATGTFSGALSASTITGSTFISTKYEPAWSTYQTMTLNQGQLEIKYDNGAGTAVVNASNFFIRGSSASTYASLDPIQLTIENSSGSLIIRQGLIQSSGSLNFTMSGGTLNFVGSVNFGSATVSGLTVAYAQNADTLDGYSSGDFSLSGHIHSGSEYVKPYTTQQIQLRVDTSLNRLYVYNGAYTRYINLL